MLKIKWSCDIYGRIVLKWIYLLFNFKKNGIPCFARKKKTNKMYFIFENWCEEWDHGSLLISMRLKWCTTCHCFIDMYVYYNWVVSFQLISDSDMKSVFDLRYKVQQISQLSKFLWNLFLCILLLCRSNSVFNRRTASNWAMCIYEANY